MSRNKTNNSPQKGERRQILHAKQNNVGNDKNPPAYEDHNGNPLK